MPGTRVDLLTDGWQSYEQLANHGVLNHRLNFVDQLDPEIHTQRIEGSWAMVKQRYQAMYGTSDNLFQSHT